MGLVFEPDSMNGNVDHAPENAQEEERKEILRRNPEFGESPREQAELNESEDKKQEEKEREKKEKKERREKHALSFLLGSRQMGHRCRNMASGISRVCQHHAFFHPHILMTASRRVE